MFERHKKTSTAQNRGNLFFFLRWLTYLSHEIDYHRSFFQSAFIVQLLTEFLFVNGLILNSLGVQRKAVSDTLSSP